MPSHPKSAGAAAAVALLAVLAAGATAGENAPPRPHMMYFYNPSCRLCTGANEVVGAVEKKHAGAMGHQRFNIADYERGADNVLYMFELLDEMEVPDDGNITLVVFLGLLETAGPGESTFTPKRVLVEGGNIIANLEKEAAAFLSAPTAWKGATPDQSRPASFFFPDGAGLR
ncbi:MAG: hypothetical protein LBU64_04640 [Planctomycetota bacterium]|nr:hypothetical protein [Planctomycetota bacterium]